MAIKIWAIPSFTFTAGVLSWSKTDLQQIDRKIRTTFTQFGLLHPNSAIGDQIRLRNAIRNATGKNVVNSCGDEEEIHLEEPLHKKRLVTDEKAESGFLLEGCSQNEQPNIMFEVINLSEASTSTFSSSSFSTTSSSTECNHQKGHITLENIKEVFSTDLLGQALLEKSKKTPLSNHDRDKICDILITFWLNKRRKIDHLDFSLISNHLVSIFPIEKKSTYFISPIKKHKSRKKKSERARGKLIDKYRNRSHTLKALELSTHSLNKNEQEETPDIPQSARDSQIWLKQNVAGSPMGDLLEHWKRSLPLRSVKNCDTIESFLETWPILKTQLAYELIDYDFQHMNSEKIIDVQEQFNDLFTKIFELKGSISNSNDSSISALIDGEITTNSKNAIKLYLIPALIPSKGSTRIHGKKHWKPSICETRDSIFVHVTTPADIEAVKQRRTALMFQKGLTLQPYIILVGPSLGNIISSLIIINNYHYKADSVIGALDFCFKSHQILDASYPFESRHIWYLFQWLLYDYKTKNDPKIPILNEFL
ncbi:uncharacterized protein LOC123322012 [Coccinella septempunctata]|uniref:uncharacterized protein LOC123322012 n=1 Tax=Coccinella septempunctata TaxID=41139 RepID=UPI001D0912C5|nr:uncharacterized protein LOC123322012 [Coccinella septempunctata]